jgi:hypothetical protein
MQSQDRHNLWVLAESVFSKDRVLRKISRLELLLAMWDYAGKIWYKGLSNTQIEDLFQARVQCAIPSRENTQASGV